METENLKVILNNQLPTEILELPPSSNSQSLDFIKNILTKTLPSSDSKNLVGDFKWKFLLEKHSFEKRKKNFKTRKTFLTRRQRKHLGLLKLPKEGWNYADLENVRQMWRDYMTENLDLIKKAPVCTDSDWIAFSTVIAKSELVGAELIIVRSKVPSLVRLSGTVVLETKMTFQIVTSDSKLKTIIKDGSVFEFHLGNMRFTVFGKYLSTKPSERSVKKIKSTMLPDL